MQREKLKSYIGIAMQAGYAILGSDNLKSYGKKLYLVIMDESGAKTCQKVFDKLVERGIEGYKVSDLEQLCQKENCKIIAFKNKGLSEEIKKYLI